MEKKIEESFKPRTWLLIVLIIIGLGIAVVLVDKYIKNRGERLDRITNIFKWGQEQIDDNFDGIESQIDEQIKDTQEEIQKSRDEYEIRRFNSTYESSAGTQWGTTVVRILDKVITNNKTNKDHIITVSYNGVDTQDEETIRSFKSNFETFTDYEIIFDYDDNGYINKVTLR